MKFIRALAHVFWWNVTAEEAVIFAEISGYWALIDECSEIFARIGNDASISHRIDVLKRKLWKIVPISIALVRKRHTQRIVCNDELFKIKLGINRLLQECKGRERILKRVKAGSRRQEIANIILPQEWNNSNATVSDLELRIGQYATRVWSIERNAERATFPKLLAMNLELMGILEELQWIKGESVIWLLAYLDSVLEKLAQITRGKVVSTVDWSKLCINTAPNDNRWDGSFHQLKPQQLVAIQTIGRFRRHVWNPSSTRVTNKWSVWDGSFWYRAVNRLLYCLSDQIEGGIIDLENWFSWKWVSDIHLKGTQYINTIDDFPVLLTNLQDFDAVHSLEDNLRLLARVLESIRWTWRFRSEKNFKILIPTIENFQ